MILRFLAFCTLMVILPACVGGQVTVVTATPIPVTQTPFVITATPLPLPPATATATEINQDLGHAGCLRNYSSLRDFEKYCNILTDYSFNGTASGNPLVPEFYRFISSEDNLSATLFPPSSIALDVQWQAGSYSIELTDTLDLDRNVCYILKVLTSSEIHFSDNSNVWKDNIYTVTLLINDTITNTQELILRDKTKEPKMPFVLTEDNVWAFKSSELAPFFRLRVTIDAKWGVAGRDSRILLDDIRLFPVTPNFCTPNNFISF
jgi:hypothetical protein